MTHCDNFVNIMKKCTRSWGSITEVDRGWMRSEREKEARGWVREPAGITSLPLLSRATTDRPREAFGRLARATKHPPASHTLTQMLEMLYRIIIFT